MVDRRVTIEPMFQMQRSADQPVVSMQVIGERSSGTNFTHKLLRETLGLERETLLGWKHGFPHVPHVRPDMLVICVVRNAVDWLISMHRRPWHATADLQALPFEKFIRAPWTTEVGAAGYFNPDKRADLAGLPLQFDRHPITGEVFPNLIQLRNCKLAALLGMRKRAPNHVFVQFETILADPRAFVLRLREEFGLQGKDDFDVGPQRLGSKFHAEISKRPPTPDALGDKGYRFLMKQLDQRQEALAGYAYARRQTDTEPTIPAADDT